jgi:hypothetical protein
VSIKDIEVPNPKTASQSSTSKVAEAIVEGTGSGFVWDKLGHIVRFLLFFLVVLHVSFIF